MNCWCVFFEAVFRSKIRQEEPRGIFSSALTPTADEISALNLLEVALFEEGIDLVEINRSFLLDPKEIDFSNPENVGWISWYNSVLETNGVVFTPWQIFDRDG